MGLIVLHVHGAMSHIAVKRSLLPYVSRLVALRLCRECSEPGAIVWMPLQGTWGESRIGAHCAGVAQTPRRRLIWGKKPRQVVCEPRLSHNMHKVVGGLDRCQFQSILYVHVDRSGYGAGHSRFFVGVHTAAENKMARRAC